MLGFVLLAVVAEALQALDERLLSGDKDVAAGESLGRLC